MVVLMEDLNRVVNNADLVADSRNILGNLRKSHFTRFAALFSVMMVYYSRPVGNDVDLDHVCSFKFMSEDTSTIRLILPPLLFNISRSLVHLALREWRTKLFRSFACSNANKTLPSSVWPTCALSLLR